MKILARVLFVATVVISLRAPVEAKGFEFTEKLTAQVQKPEIQILITRQNLVPKYVLELKETFLPKIVDSINQKPF